MDILLVGQQDVQSAGTHQRFNLDALAFSIESIASAVVHLVSSASEAIDRVLDGARYDLIVLHVGGATQGDPSLRLIKYLISAELKIPIILIGKESELVPAQVPGYPILGTIITDKVIEELGPIIETQIKSGAFEPALGLSDYCRIKTELLTKVFPLQADVFIRLSQNKILKIFQKGDVFDQKDLNEYLHKRKVDYFFLKWEDCSVFLSAFKVAMNELFQARGAQSLDQQEPNDIFNLCDAIQEAVHEFSRQLGFTPAIQELVHDNVKLTLEAVKRDTKTAFIFERLKSNRGRYISTHSILLANLACILSTKLQWHSDATFEKLSYAALLHDVTLPSEDDELAKIGTLEELKLLTPPLSKERMDEYLTHPLRASQVAREFAAIPADVAMIILQHHEQPDGTGFPKHLDSKQIAPISCVFILAHELFSDQAKGLSLAASVARIRKKYDYGHFKKIVYAVTELSQNG